MHEYSLMASVMDRVQEIAHEQGDLPVEQVKLDIGVLQEVVPDLLAWAFDVAKEGTLAADAVLSWDLVEPRLVCSACNQAYVPEDVVFWECPACHWNGAEVVQGDELLIRSVVLTAPEDVKTEKAKE